MAFKFQKHVESATGEAARYRKRQKQIARNIYGQLNREQLMDQLAEYCRQLGRPPKPDEVPASNYFVQRMGRPWDELAREAARRAGVSVPRRERGSADHTTHAD